MRIIPDGRKLLVLPIAAKEDSLNGIIIPAGVATADLSEAEVVEVSKDLSDKFKKGDIVMHPSKSGLGQLYQGKLHLWLREEIGEIWGVVSDESKPKDKGDSL
jgi:co-chaperonin GroES (HSP10)